MATEATEPDVAELDPPVGPLPRMTEEQFVAWSDEERRGEWVDGEVVPMPAMDYGHARSKTFLTALLEMFVEEHDLSQILHEPYQVRFAGQRRRRMPDLFFIASGRDASLRNTEFDGAPDLIVEIVSPESQRRDRREKFAEYEAAGVGEYWLLDRPRRSFEAYGPRPDGKYVRLPEVDGRVYSAVMVGVHFQLDWAWQVRYPKVMPLLRAMADDRRRLLGAG